MFKAFFSLRPVLIVALAAGSILFAPDIPERQDAPQTTGDAATNAAPSTESNDGAAALIEESPISIFGELFGKDAIDPLFHLPETDPRLRQDFDGQAKSEIRNAEPEQEPARSIYRYLVAASEIGFEANASRLGLALSTAEKSDTKLLDRLITELEGKSSLFQSLVPPPELRDIHEASSRVLLRYVQHLKQTRANAPGGVERTWTRPERAAIGEEAAAITQKIRDIVHTHNISLPEGVLP